MRRLLSMVLLAAAGTVAPAAAAGAAEMGTAEAGTAEVIAASCSAAGSAAVTGGYRVTLLCSGAGYVKGHGSTLSAANQEALLLYQVYTTYGRDCSATSLATTAGGYRSTILCTSPQRYIDGYGSTLTEASGEARALAVLTATGGPNCSGVSSAVVSGGYRVRLLCDVRYIDGLGSTLTGAARNARFAASV